MKKTTHSVFVRILSLALVMALILTSVISSLVFTASATTAEYYKEVIDFEDGALPSDAVLGDKFTVTAPVEENGNYSLYRSYASGGMAYVDFYNFDMTAGTTYIIQYDYYVVPAAEGETYSTWQNLKAYYETGETEIFSTSPTMYGKWYTKSATFTPKADVSRIRLNADYSNIYFDNITVIEYKNYAETFGSYYEIDFSDYDNALDAPLFSKTSASIVYDEVLGKNVYAVNVSAGQTNLTFVPVYTKANTKYSVNITYKVTDWCCAVINGDYNGGIALDSKSYVSKPFTFTNNTEGALFGFSSTGGSRTLYISSIKVSEYFDTTVGTAENGTGTVSATEAPANTTVTYTAKANAGYVFDYWADAQGNKVSESATYVHTVTADTVLTPVFAKNANTSAYQSYDFDKVSPTLVSGTTEYTTDKDGNVTNAFKVVTNNTAGQNQNLFYLDADLESNKLYKISFDYKGTGYLWSYVSLTKREEMDWSASWSNAQFFEISTRVALSSDIWARHEAVITSNKAHNVINFLTDGNASCAGNLYIDNVVIEEYEVGVDYYSEDFEDGTTFVGGASSRPADKIVNDPTNSNNKVLYKAATSSPTQYFIATPRLEAGKTYNISIDAYAATDGKGWFGLERANQSGNLEQKGPNATTTWKTFNYNYTATADGEFFRINTQNELYFDNIVIKEIIVNTADKQTYDYDRSVPTEISGAANSSIETVIGADGKTSNAIYLNASSAAAKRMFRLDASLTAGKVYKLTYNYKGDLKLRFMLYMGSGWGSSGEMYSAEEWISMDEPAILSSTDWATREITFTAKYNSPAVYLYADGGNGYIDNIVFEESAYEAFDKYTLELDEPLVNKASGAFSIATAPNGEKAILRTANTSGATVWLNAPKLLAGHKYYVTFNYYADPNVSASTQNYYTKLIRSNKTATVKEYGGRAVAGKWEKFGALFTAETDGESLAIFANDIIYFTDITVIDVTNKLSNTGNYSEDFSNTDETTFLQSTKSAVEYVADEELGKNIAVVNFKNTAANDYGWVKIPYLMQNGVQYRVKMTYKSTAWLPPFINGAIDGGQGAVTTDEWTNAYWYITGKGDTDYFAFGTAETSTVQIASIEIEKLTLIEGDINNDGEVLANDLVLLTKYLLGVKDERIFAGKYNDTTVYSTGNADIKEDGKIDILDFIRLKKTVSGTVTLTDDASSVNAVAYETENIALSTTSADLLEDKSSFKVAVSGEDAYIIYKLSGGITEAAVEYDIGVSFMGDFSFEVSKDGKSWTEVTAQDISKEEINLNSWVRVTEYFGGLGNVSYFKINFPETVTGAGTACHVRTVQINGLTADTLYNLKGYNSLLREAETVYVSNSGDDNNSGLSAEAPLKTLSAAFGRMLVPGDKILLERGSTFEGEVKILSSGTQTAPIVVGSYGEGDKPVITGFDTAIKVTGEYVQISDLAFTDADAYSAVDFYALKEGVTKGVSVTNCDFYEINTVADGGSHARESGGVHFLAKGNKPAWFDGVTVSGNTFNRVGRNAIYVSSDWAARDTEQKWGNKNFKLEGKPVFLSKNVVIENNYIKENSGDAITVIGTDGALIEYNTVADSKLIYNVNYAIDEDTNEYIYDENGEHKLANIAWAAIWCHSSDNCVMQYNEVYGNRADNQGQDLQAFDIDLSCNNCVVQYNYSHDNDGGFLLLCGEDSANNGGVSGSIVRYNLSVNDAAIGGYVIDITGSVADSQIYNNTIYCGNNTDSAVKNIKLVNLANYQKVTVKSSNTVFTNNIFYAEDGVSAGYGYGDANTTPAFQNIKYNNNIFYGIEAPSYDNVTVTNTVTTKPVFANAGAEATGLSNGENYKVANIDSLVGEVIENNGGQDYLGKILSDGSTLIGAIK